jgi:hypothetical protein
LASDVVREELERSPAPDVDTHGDAFLLGNTSLLLLVVDHARRGDAAATIERDHGVAIAEHVDGRPHAIGADVSEPLGVELVGDARAEGEPRVLGLIDVEAHDLDRVRI